MLRAESSVERPRRACPVLTGCLPAGRQGRGASHLKFFLVPSSQLVVFFQHDSEIFETNRLLVFLKDFTEESARKFIVSFRQSLPLIEMSSQIDHIGCDRF